MKNLNAFSLAFCLSLSPLSAGAKTPQKAHLLASIYQQEILTPKIQNINESIKKLKSWDEFKEQGSKNLSEKDKAIFLAKIGLVQGHPFKLPSFTALPQGWILEIAGQALTVDVVNQTLSMKKKTLKYQDKSMEQIMDWIEGSTQKVSFIPSWIIDDAHANPFVLAGPIILGLYGVYSVGKLTWNAEDECLTNYGTMLTSLAVKIHQCQEDNEANRITDNTRNQILEYVNIKSLKGYTYDKNTCRFVALATFHYNSIGSVTWGSKPPSCIVDRQADSICEYSKTLEECWRDLDYKIFKNDSARQAGKELPFTEKKPENKSTNGVNQQ